MTAPSITCESSTMRLVLCAVLVVLTSVPGLAAAEDVRVLVVELLPGAAHAWPEADRHLRAELAHSGLEVVALPLAEIAELELVTAIEREAEARSALAALMLFRDASSGSVRVWVIDRWTGKLVARSLDGEGLEPGEVALRAMELLHASLVEVRLAHHRSERENPAIVERLVERALPSRSRWTASVDLGTGLALAASSTPALGVHVRARARAPYGLVLEVAADTTLTSMVRDVDAGRASVSFAGFVGRIGARSRGPVSLGGSVGSGVLVAWGEGQANEGWRGRSDLAWVAVLDVHVEGRVKVAQRLDVSLGLTVRFAIPGLSLLERSFAQPLWLPSLALSWEGR